jgi:hypothetical protein
LREYWPGRRPTLRDFERRFVAIVQTLQAMPVMLGKPARHCRQLAAGQQLVARIGPGSIEQAIAYLCIIEISRDERFHHQIGKAIEEVRWPDIRPGCDRARCFEVERSSEDRQAAQNDTFKLGQQVVAPVECRSQCLVPGQRRPSPTRQQIEAIIDTGGQFLDSKRGGAGRGQLDRQRDPVQAAADRCHHRRRALVRRKAWLHGTCSLEKVGPRRFADSAHHRQHPRPAPRVVAPDIPPPRPSEARDLCEEMQPEVRLQQRFGHLCSGVDHVLAGIQHQQYPPPSQRLRDAPRRDLTDGQLEPNRRATAAGTKLGSAIGESVTTRRAICRQRIRAASDRLSRRPAASFRDRRRRRGLRADAL